MKRVLVVCLLVICTLILESSGNGCIAGSQWKQRAEQSMSLFMQSFWDSQTNYLFKYYPNNYDDTQSQYWNFAVAYDVLVTAASFLDLNQYQPYISKFFAGQNSIGWDREYYDDLNWMCMALLNAHNLTRSSEYLNKAETLFHKVMAAWDTTCCGSTPGGIWWDTLHESKAAASNAGPAATAVLLYQATGNSSYLHFGLKVYYFWRENMVNSSTGEVGDHISAPNGQKVYWSFTYNQGLMIGAGIYLYEATKDQTYLNDASLVATFLCKSQVTASGQVLTDNCGYGFDCPQFKGIGYKFLSMLYKNYFPSNSLFKAVLLNSVNSLWNNARTPEGFFGTHWAGPAPDPELPYVVSTPENSCAMQALLYACTIQ
eukprot:TRINITY_DN3411_c0_g2_i1.p1 TRINITY_DN3411_c0_g2~~TRINITY_DN3411_c0_g2_i1.p1  ORF type:complete len:372 (-),score=31.57 TRINITY_DN3411_c0_g2_i1:34-1149(-)